MQIRIKWKVWCRKPVVIHFNCIINKKSIARVEKTGSIWKSGLKHLRKDVESSEDAAKLKWFVEKVYVAWTKWKRGDG